MFDCTGQTYTYLNNNNKTLASSLDHDLLLFTLFGYVRMHISYSCFQLFKSIRPSHYLLQDVLID